MSERRANELTALPNLLSLTRILLVVPFVAVMLSGRPDARWWGAAIMIAAAVTDKLDGILARRYRLETEWGRILDPLSDKIGAAAVVLVLLLLHQIPFWFVCAVIGRDLAILAGGMYLRARKNVILPSNETGKWAMGILALTLFCIVLDVPSWVVSTLLAATGVMLAASLILYAVRFADVLRTPKPQERSTG